MVDEVWIYANSPIYVTNPPSMGSPDLRLDDYVSSIITRNELSYNSSPTRANDMTLHNDEEAFYVPTVEITLNYIKPSDYRKLLQLVNSKGFCLYYFDQELGEEVVRSVYATEATIEELHVQVSNVVELDGMVGVKLKFVSRYGYPYTPCSSEDFTEANKYHMAQLHLHKNASNKNYLPDGAEEPDYV